MQINKELLTELKCRKEVQGGVETSTGHLSGTKETLLVCAGLEIQKPKQSES